MKIYEGNLNLNFCDLISGRDGLPADDEDVRQRLHLQDGQLRPRHQLREQERAGGSDAAEGGRHRVREEERQGRRAHGGPQGVRAETAARVRSVRALRAEDEVVDVAPRGTIVLGQFHNKLGIVNHKRGIDSLSSQI